MSLLDCYDIGDLYCDKDMHGSNYAFWIVVDKGEKKTKNGKQYFIRMTRLEDGETIDYSEEQVYGWFRKAY